VHVLSGDLYHESFLLYAVAVELFGSERCTAGGVVGGLGLAGARTGRRLLVVVVLQYVIAARLRHVHVRT